MHESSRNPENRGAPQAAPSTIGAAATTIERIASEGGLLALSAALGVAQGTRTGRELADLGSVVVDLASETKAAADAIAAEAAGARSAEATPTNAAADPARGVGVPTPAMRQLDGLAAILASPDLGRLAEALVRRAEALRSDMARLVAAARDA